MISQIEMGGGGGRPLLSHNDCLLKLIMEHSLNEVISYPKTHCFQYEIICHFRAFMTEMFFYLLYY